MSHNHNMMLRALWRGACEGFAWAVLGVALMSLIVGALVAVGWLVRVLVMGFTV